MPAIAPAPPAPPATPSAPPAKPAPAAKPAAPPPKAAPPVETTKPVESTDPFADAFAAIDEIDSGKKPEPKKEVKEPDKEVEAPKDESKPPEEDEQGKPKEQKPVKAAELRNAYEGLKKKVKEEYEPKLKRLTELETKIKEFESRDDGQAKTTQERIAAIEKRNAELESHIRFVDYEKSSEYQEKYQKPYEDAWGNAIRELKGLTMTVDDPKGGEPITREVTQADIAYFANLEPAARRSEINRLFPEDKEEVKRHINQISYLAEQAEKARSKARADAETNAKTEAEQMQQAQANRMKLWKSSNEELSTKYPHWFSKAEDDEEGNALLDRGAALADLAFNPYELTPERIAILPKAFREQIESRKPFSQEQLIRLHSIVRNKAANHDRLVHQNKALAARVAELEKSLKDYEASGPDGIPAGGRKADNGVLDAASELDALDRKFA